MSSSSPSRTTNNITTTSVEGGEKKENNNNLSLSPEQATQREKKIVRNQLFDSDSPLASKGNETKKTILTEIGFILYNTVLPPRLHLQTRIPNSRDRVPTGRDESET